MFAKSEEMIRQNDLKIIDFFFDTNDYRILSHNCPGKLGQFRD